METKEVLKVIQVRARRYRLQKADCDDLIGYLLVTNYMYKYSDNLPKADFEKKIKTLCNKWLKQHNKQRKRQAQLEQTDSLVHSPDILSVITSYAKELPGEYEDNVKILQLKVDGCTIPEIAEATGVPESTVRWRLKKCRKE